MSYDASSGTLTVQGYATGSPSASTPHGFYNGPQSIDVTQCAQDSLVTLTLSLGQTSAALGIPLGYVYFVVPLSGLLMAWYAVRGSAVRSGETGRGPTATGGAA